MKIDKKTTKWILIAGLLLSIIPSFMPGFEFMWLAVLLGLVAGFTMTADVKTFLAILILMGTTAGLSQLPTLGSMLATIFGQIAVFFGVVAILPATKVLLGKVGMKW